VSDTFLLDPVWREPVFTRGGSSTDKPLFLSTDVELERAAAETSEWIHYWPSSDDVREQLNSVQVLTIFISLDSCVLDSWSNLSILAESHHHRLLGILPELLGRSWNLPTLTDRPEDEGSTTVEAQLERLERCSGSLASASLRAELQHQLDVDEDEQVVVPIDALRRLVDFLCSHPRVKMPYIFIAADRLKAQWQASSEQIAWIEFDATEHVRVLAFLPEAKAFGGVKRIVANSTVQSAYRDLLSFGVDWISQ
jgi:hypothetical protein